MHVSDLRILTAELDYDIRLRVILLDGNCLCHDFLCELESEPVGNGQSAGTGYDYVDIYTGELLIDLFEKLVKKA